MKTSPLPPVADADPHAASPAEAPRKPWSKPTIRTMYHTVTIESGGEVWDRENTRYQPAST